MKFNPLTASSAETVAKSQRLARKAIARGESNKSFNRRMRLKYGYRKLYLIRGNRPHVKGFLDLKHHKRRRQKQYVKPPVVDVSITELAPHDMQPFASGRKSVGRLLTENRARWTLT